MESIAFVNWVQIYDVDGHVMDLQKQRDKIAKPLYYASLAGLTEVSYVLLKMRADVMHKEDAMETHSRQHHMEVMRQLHSSSMEQM